MIDNHEVVRTILADDDPESTDNETIDHFAENILKLVVDVPHDTGHYMIFELPESASTAGDLFVLREWNGTYTKIEHFLSLEGDLPSDVLYRAFGLIAQHIRFAMH